MSFIIDNKQSKQSEKHFLTVLDYQEDDASIERL